MTKWFEAGVTCVGMGSKLITKDIRQEDKYDQLTKTVKNALDIIRKLK